MTEILILAVVFIVAILALIWPQKSKTNSKSLNLEDLVQTQTETNLKNIRLQEQEDELYYQMIKKEADKQVYNITVMGWIADPSRANLMRVYTVYDKNTAKYLNAKPIELCLKMVDEVLEDRRKQRELIVDPYNTKAAFPLTPYECYLPPYQKADTERQVQIANEFKVPKVIASTQELEGVVQFSDKLIDLAIKQLNNTRVKL